MKNELKRLKTSTGILIAMIASLPAVMIWWGYALTVLWAWFITPIFSVSTLSIAQAIGFGLVVKFLRGMSSETKIDTWTIFFSELSKAIFGPTFILFIAWIVTRFL